jgi:predicted anti-sigma-YlaC factor YlaD
MVKALTCKETTWLASESRERNLTKDEVQELEQHIAECPYCKGASQQFAVLFKQLDSYLGTSKAEKDKPA